MPEKLPKECLHWKPLHLTRHGTENYTPYLTPAGVFPPEPGSHAAVGESGAQRSAISDIYLEAHVRDPSKGR